MRLVIIALAMLIFATAYGYQTIVGDDGRTYTVYGEGERPYLSGTTEKDIEGPGYTAEEENARTSLNNVLNWAYDYDNDESKNHSRTIKSKKRRKGKPFWGAIKKKFSAWVAEWKDNRAKKKLGIQGDDDCYGIFCEGRGFIGDKKINNVDMCIRYNKGEYEICVDFYSKIFSNGIMGYCCGRNGEDNGKWNHDKWSPSVGGNAAFYCGDVIALINDMGRHSRFDVALKLSNGTICGASFLGTCEKVRNFIEYTNSKEKKKK